jgi:hypothetical protein
MFYLITSRAARRRKEELDVFGHIDTGASPWANRRISPRDKGISED